MLNNEILYPVIKISEIDWYYIKQYLKKWGYNICLVLFAHDYEYLVINNDNRLGICNVIKKDNIKLYNRKLVKNIDEFLNIAAKFKGYSYMKKDKYFNIDIKPGNIFYVHDPHNNELFFIVFPTKQNLNVVGVGFTYMNDLNNFYDDYYDYIVKIYDGMNNGSLLDGNVIWSKSKIKLTKKEIAEKFGYSEDMFDII